MRLDLYLSEREGISRTRAQNLIKTGGVKVDGVLVDKPSIEVNTLSDIIVTDTVKYASLGGIKLENALNTFGINVNGLHCLDVGAANGGFTDCLLKQGAASVCAVDLTIAFPSDLINDKRVTILDHTNVKDLKTAIGDQTFDFLCADLSFISLTGMFELFSSFLKAEGKAVLLFKPQFEVGRKFLPKSGVVRDKKAIEKTFSAFLSAARVAGFKPVGHCAVPDVFPDKNEERTVYFTKL